MPGPELCPCLPNKIGYHRHKPLIHSLLQVLRWPDDIPALASQLSARLSRVVQASVERLDAAYAVLAGAAMYGGDAAAQERHLRGAMHEYFGQAAAGGAAVAGGDGGDAEGPDGAAAGKEAGLEQQHDMWEMPWGGASPVQRPQPEQLQRMVRGFMRAEAARLRDVGHDRLSGLVVARLLAGLGSPAYPSDAWRKVAEWGRLHAVDFPLLVAAADAELPALWDA